MMRLETGEMSHDRHECVSVLADRVWPIHVARRILGCNTDHREEGARGTVPLRSRTKMRRRKKVYQEKMSNSASAEVAPMLDVMGTQI